jgi:uncharacterized protein
VPSNPLYLLRLNARELLRQPGLQRTIETELEAGDLGVDDERITGAIEIELQAVSNFDGIVVEGVISTPWRAPCRRCLSDVRGVARTDVEELYQEDVQDDDAYEIEGDQIDLAPAVREYVLLELPDGPLCRDDCAGICPVCGTDRNEGDCECDTTLRDERWAVLDSLRLDSDTDPA